MSRNALAAAGGRTPLVSLASGTFARALAAYQRDSDPTSGAFMTVVGTNVLRWETLASGGRLAFIEGARTNSVRYSRDRSQPGYWQAGSMVIETSGQAGPDGAALAYREQVTSGGFARYAVSIATAAPFVASQWIKRGGSNTSRFAQVYNLAVLTTSESASDLSATWMRDVIRVAGGTSDIYIPVDGRAGSSIAAGDRDEVSDLPQVEAGRFASSPIVNAGTTGATRPADVLTWASAPLSMLTDLHGFLHVRPQFTSSLEVGDGDAFWLMSIADGNNGIRIAQASGVLTVDAVAGGVVKARSQPLTTIADVDLGSVVWDPGAGLVYLNGTPGPAGTAWTWSAGALRVGGIYGGTNEAFCGLSDIY